MSGLLGRIDSLHDSFFLGSWVGWVGRGQEAGLALGSLHIAFLGSWVGWVVRGQEAGLPLGSLHVSFFLGPGSDGFGRGKEAGLHWAPFVFLFCAPGSDGRVAANPVGLPSYFLLSGLLDRMGGPQQRSWAPFILLFWAPGSDESRPGSWASVGFPSYFLSGLWVGWVSRGQEAGPIGSLHISFFLGSWVGWVVRGQEAGLVLGSLHIAFLGSWIG